MLEAEFYAHTSELETSNIHEATMAVTGGPHPGVEGANVALSPSM